MENQSVDLTGAIDTLKDMLSGEDGQQQIQNILNMFSGNTPENTAIGNATGGIDPENLQLMFKIQNIMSKLNNKKNNSQTQLLSALRPFLKPSRREKVDTAMRLLSFSDVFEIIRESQGD